MRHSCNNPFTPQLDGASIGTPDAFYGPWWTDCYDDSVRGNEPPPAINHWSLVYEGRQHTGILTKTMTDLPYSYPPQVVGEGDSRLLYIYYRAGTFHSNLFSCFEYRFKSNENRQRFARDLKTFMDATVAASPGDYGDFTFSDQARLPIGPAGRTFVRKWGRAFAPPEMRMAVEIFERKLERFHTFQNPFSYYNDF